MRPISKLRAWLGLLLVLASTIAVNAADYVIVVDTSGSMRDRISNRDNRIRITTVQNALREYLPALPQSARIHFIAFSAGIVSEKELRLDDSAALKEALSWVDSLDPLARRGQGTHLWTTLGYALEVATQYSRDNPSQPVIVRVLTDGEDNERVTSLEGVLKRFPLVDGEHIRGNLVLLGDFELKTKLALPDEAFTITKSTTWSDLFPPIVLWFPANPKAGEDVRFVENTHSIYSDYEWFIDGQAAGTEKVLLWRFAEARTHRVMLKVKELQGNADSTTVFVKVQPKESFSVDVISTGSTTVPPGEKVRFWVRPSAPPSRFAWFVNENAAGSTETFEHQFDSEGTFQVKAVVWTASGIAASNACTFTVEESPLAVQIEAPTQATAGQPVQFAAEITGAFAKIEWNFGDGTTAAEKDPVHTFDLERQASKDFQIQLHVQSPLGRITEAGPHSLRVQARQQIKPPLAAFRLFEPSIRAGEPVHLMDESQGYIESWEWRVGGVRVASDKNAVIKVAEPGPTSVTLVVRGPGGTNEVSRRVSVNPQFTLVQLKIAASPLSGKAPLSVQFTNLGSGDVRAWLWEFGDGNSSTNINPQHTFAVGSNYTVAVTACPSDTNQQPSRAQLTIKAAKPWPMWAKGAFLASFLGSLAGLIAWLVRQRQRAKLRLAVFWWPEQAAVCRRADLNTPDQTENLNPGVPLRIRRIGKTQSLLAEALDGASIVMGDGQEAASQNIGQGARIVVKAASGAAKAVAITVNQKPRCPSPASTEIAVAASQVKSSPPQGASSGDFDWGWDPAATTRPN